MKTCWFALIAGAMFATNVSAQEWPEKMVQPSDYAWEALWPINNAAEASKMFLGDTYNKQAKEFDDFFDEAHPSGMQDNFLRYAKFASGLTFPQLAARVGAMTMTDVEKFSGKGFEGEFKLVGMKMVGPHQCHQVEWSARKTSGAIVGKGGKASGLELYCLSVENDKWIMIEGYRG